MGVKKARKTKEQRRKDKNYFFERLALYVSSYPQVIIVSADHVGSRQMAEIRTSLRGKAILLMGKNTMIRKCLLMNKEKLSHVDALMSTVHLNMGFVFCLTDPAEVRKIIQSNVVPAPARQGVLAPKSVHVKAGATGLDPSQTSFFQALGISTKIVKGQIEIQNEIQLIEEGTRVTASQSALLKKLNVLPFEYGLITSQVFDDGALYDAKVLDIKDEDILERFNKGVTNVAAFSINAGYPTAASINHSIIGAFKHCAAIGLETGNIFKQMEQIKKMLDDPSAFAAAAPAAAPAAAAKGAPKAAAKAAPVEESSDEGGMGLDLFG
eukprot:Selendium_serpulae@DN4876_c0_g1_i1.p1